jgi:Transposase
MIRKMKVTRGGQVKTFVSVIESYRPGPGMHPKQRVVKAFGYLEEQDDPAAFMAQVELFQEEHKKEKKPLKKELDATTKMYSQETRKYNYGYKFLEAVYDMLDIDTFIREHLRAKNFRGEYPPQDIFRFLVLTRLLAPDSKRATLQRKEQFYGMKTDFTLVEVYRALDIFCGFETELQQYLNEKVKETIGRDLSHAFYDVTNYFFDIDFPDGLEDLRQNGVSKEHRVDPIVAMGLIMDLNGLPVNMSLFPGNTSDSVTLQPTLRDVRKSYNLGRLTVVADKGLNSSGNIDYLVNNGDGFLFSQVLRGTKGKRYHEKLFDPNGWKENLDGSYRYKLFNEEYAGKDKDGKSVKRTRRVLLYWSQADAQMAARKREVKLQKAARSVKNNVYSIKKGVDEYTKNNVVDKKTGIVLEDTKNVRSINWEKAEQDARFDGFFCLITSELDYNAEKMREVYSGLWRIEQSFRILKSDLGARPVYVRKNEHIRAHFLICFVALLLLRILQHKMGDTPLSSERIARALNEATCRISKNGIVELDDVGGMLAFVKEKNKKGEWVDTLEFSNEDEVALDYKRIQELFGTDYYHVYHRQEQFNQLLKNIRLR